jgi:hypothetical protein
MVNFAKTRIAIVAALVCAASVAHARPYTPEMACGRVANIVSLNGAMVMDTGPNTYDRYVVSKAYCTPQERLKAAFVPTANDDQCFIGYTCEQRYGKGHR